MDRPHATEGDIDDRLHHFGYDAATCPKLKIAFVEGRETVMPRSWMLQGTLFTLTFNAPLALKRHASDDHDATAPSYHDLDFLRNAERQGYDGVVIADAVKDSDGDLLHHEAIGLTAAGLARASVSRRPAHHLTISEWRNTALAA
jgi:hypothetical protein